MKSQIAIDVTTIDKKGKESITNILCMSVGKVWRKYVLDDYSFEKDYIPEVIKDIDENMPGIKYHLRTVNKKKIKELCNKKDITKLRDNLKKVIKWVDDFRLEREVKK